MLLPSLPTICCIRALLCGLMRPSGSISMLGQQGLILALRHSTVTHGGKDLPWTQQCQRASDMSEDGR